MVCVIYWQIACAESSNMQLNKGDIIIDGKKYFSVFCILGSVIYVKEVSEVNNTPGHTLEDVLKHYRKIEIMKN